MDGSAPPAKSFLSDSLNAAPECEPDSPPTPEAAATNLQPSSSSSLDSSESEPIFAASAAANLTLSDLPDDLLLKILMLVDEPTRQFGVHGVCRSWRALTACPSSQPFLYADVVVDGSPLASTADSSAGGELGGVGLGFGDSGGASGRGGVSSGAGFGGAPLLSGGDDHPPSSHRRRSGRGRLGSSSDLTSSLVGRGSTPPASPRLQLLQRARSLGGGNALGGGGDTDPEARLRLDPQALCRWLQRRKGAVRRLTATDAILSPDAWRLLLAPPRSAEDEEEGGTGSGGGGGLFWGLRELHLLGDTARTLAWDALPRAGAVLAAGGDGGGAAPSAAPPPPSGEWSSSSEESDDDGDGDGDGDGGDGEPRPRSRSRSPLPASASPPATPRARPLRPPPLRALTVRECEGSLGEPALRHLPPQLTSLALEAAGAPDGGGGLLRSGRPFLDGFCPVLLSLTRLRDLSLASRGVGAVPEGISALTRLTRLAVTHAGLTTLPRSLAQLRRLAVAELQGNLLLRAGALGLGAGAGAEAEAEAGHSEQARASLAPLAALASTLTSLDLSGNGLRADGHTALPGPVLGALTNLVELRLAGNAGLRVPRSLSRLASLTLLDLRACGLRDYPQGLSHLRGVATLLLGSNAKVAAGAWPSVGGALDQLEGLSLGEPAQAAAAAGASDGPSSAPASCGGAAAAALAAAAASAAASPPASSSSSSLPSPPPPSFSAAALPPRHPGEGSSSAAVAIANTSRRPPPSPSPSSPSPTQSPFGSAGGAADAGFLRASPQLSAFLAAHQGGGGPAAAPAAAPASAASAVAQLTRVRVLDLSRSGIRRLPSGAAALTSLEELRLCGVSSYPGAGFDWATLAFVGRSLRRLDVSGSYLGDGALPASLEGLPLLRELRACECGLTRLVATKKGKEGGSGGGGRGGEEEAGEETEARAAARLLPRVALLHLDGNRLSLLPASSLAALPRLRAVSLVDNLPMQLPPDLGALARAPSLERVDARKLSRGLCGSRGWSARSMWNLARSFGELEAEARGRDWSSVLLL